jgi:hypothetical protein
MYVFFEIIGSNIPPLESFMNVDPKYESQVSQFSEPSQKTMSPERVRTESPSRNSINSLRFSTSPPRIRDMDVNQQSTLNIGGDTKWNVYTKPLGFIFPILFNNFIS